MASGEISIKITVNGQGVASIEQETSEVEPWSIRTPAGTRFAWLDINNQEHWLLETDTPRPDWRRLYVEKREAATRDERRGPNDHRASCHGAIGELLCGGKH